MTDVLRLIPLEVMKSLSKKDLITLLEGEQAIRSKFQIEIDHLRSAHKGLEDQILEINGKYIKLKSMIFDRSSEKSKKDDSEPEAGDNNNPPKKGKRRPKKRKKSSKNLTEKYPNLPIVEQTVSFEERVDCPCCQAQMSGSGMSAVVEFLDITPKKYSIIRQSREKYRCGKCHGSPVSYTHLTLPTIYSV